MAARRKHIPLTADEQGFPPTPQTVAKLRTDVVLKLHRAGRLRLEHLQAAEELRRMWAALGRGLFASAARLDAPVRRAQGAPFQDPLGRFTRAEDIIFRRRYRPWSREMSVALVAGARATKLQLVLDIVVDNLGTGQADRRYAMRHGTALRILQAALHRYAEVAEWVRPRGGIA